MSRLCYCNEEGIQMVQMKEISPNCGYFITDDGRLISHRYRKGTAEKELSPFITNSGYKAIILRFEGTAKIYYIHRLVALAFCPILI